MLTTIALYLSLGAVAGILAGLLGVGGGLVIVPLLSFAFAGQNLPSEHIMHLALGTSLATIICTSISSMRSHHARGAVRWDIFIRIAPGIIVGTFVGSYLASSLSTGVLKGVFVTFLYWVATQMLLGIKPPSTRTLPATPGMLGSGGIIGCISSIVGIGGGTMSVPFLIWCNISMRTAIGTSSAIGLPLAISGALGYMMTGWSIETLPAYSLGYIYLPALLGIICASVLTAPLGAKLAHTLPVPKLKRIFSILLYAVATKMLLGLL